MSNVYFIGDLHFGHANIACFRSEFASELDHREALVDKWNRRITKRDLVFVMGDAAFTQEGLNDVGLLNGRKILVRGNHDLLPTEAYLEYFEEVYGLLKYKGLWLSHAPIHGSELWGRSNVHGHCHRGGPMEVQPETMGPHGQTLGMATWFNTCAEHLPDPYVPIAHQEMLALIRERIRNG
jgi:calcineurin-like phosphoesterase family protein